MVPHVAVKESHVHFDGKRNASGGAYQSYALVLMKVLITGVHGFIARHLAPAFRAAKYEVWGTTRDGVMSPSEAQGLNGTLPFDLSSGRCHFDLSGFDCIVHLAHDLRRGESERNIRGTQQLAKQALNGGVSRQIFVSSYSARRDAVTEYGRTKYALEQWCGSQQIIIVRPGLVVGPGGLFHRIYKLVLKSPVVPLLGGGMGKIPIVDIGDLSRAFVCFIELAHPAAEYNLFNRELATLRTVVEKICKLSGKTRILLSIPTAVVLPPLEALQKLGIALPVNADNVRAFAHNQQSELQSHLIDVIGEERSLDEMLLSMSATETGL